MQYNTTTNYNAPSLQEYATTKMAPEPFHRKGRIIALAATIVLTSHGISTDNYKSSPSTLNEAINIYNSEKIEERYNENLITLELKEILQDREIWEREEIFISELSIFNAINFVENSIKRYGLPSPNIEVHPDGQTSFTWRKNKIGIVNIAFDDNGLATWAAYFESPKRSIKGNFMVKDSISEEERNIIKKISGIC